jgi:uncharacterized membrane protein YhaH (DUF805 family)
LILSPKEFTEILSNDPSNPKAMSKHQQNQARRRQQPAIFPRALDRPGYLFRLFLCVFFMGAVGLIGGAIALRYGRYDLSGQRIKLILWASMGIGWTLWLAYGLPFILAPRLRDAGISGWIALFGLVPLLGYLVFIFALFLPTGAVPPEPKKARWLK